MAIIPVPRILPRIISLHSKSSSKHNFLFLSDIVRYFADALFLGHIALGHGLPNNKKQSPLCR